MATTTVLVHGPEDGDRIEVKIKARGVCTFHAWSYGEDHGPCMVARDWTKAAIQLLARHREFVDTLGLVKAQASVLESDEAGVPTVIEVVGQTLGNRRKWRVKWTATDSDTDGRLFFDMTTSRPLTGMEYAAAFKAAIRDLERRADHDGGDE